VVLDGKIALVTGAAKGIGKGCATVLGQQGAAVAVADVDEPAGTSTVGELQTQGVRSLFVRCDVSIRAEVETLMSRVVAEFGRLDILVNNAGYHLSKSVADTSEQEWDYILNSNLKSVFLCSKYAIPYLRKNRGCIVNMSSMVGLVGQTNAGAYSASKGGTVAMTKGMALDLAVCGVRVNGI